MPEPLLTPYLQSQPAFDPRYEHIISFVYDGPQAFKNRLVITDNDTSSDIYDRIQIGMKLSHTIPAETLSSNKQYLAKIKVYDDSGNESDFSTPIIFYCFTAPLFHFVGLESDNTIHSANLNVSLEYSQIDGEPLQQYQFELYQYDKTPLYSSDIFYYDGSSAINNTFFGLKNDTYYYVKAIGKTQHGMTLDTGLIRINVEYIMIPANMLFRVENDKKNGYITLESGIIDIGYEVDNDNYIFSDGEVTLTDNKVTYNAGFEIQDDFCAFIKARKLPLKGVFFIMPQTEGRIELSIERICCDYYCILSIDSPAGNYKRYAELPKAYLADGDNNLITDFNNKYLMLTDMKYWDKYTTVFELKRKNHLYSLKTYYEPNGIILI